MDFLKLIQSLDDLLYEIMSWLVFYPITLWRTLTSPLRMMNYSDYEQTEANADDQYSDTLSPPLFLLLTLAWTHGVRLGLVGQEDIVADRTGLSALIDSDSTLLVFSLILFSLVPLLLAVRLVRASGAVLDRNSLRAPFYSQCYVAALLVIIIAVAEITMQRLHSLPGIWAGIGLFVAGWIIFGIVQTRWYAQHLGCSTLRAFGNASRALFECVVAMTLLSALFQ